MEKRINMKTWLLGTAFLLISMFAGTSCVMDNDDLPDCPDPTPPVINKEAPAITAYLYCNNKRMDWETGSKIGVYMIDNEKETLLQDSLGAPYVLNDNTTGLFLPQWGGGDQVLTRPEPGVIWDATGIYPWGTSLKNANTFTLSILDQKKQEELDIFTAKRVKNITAATDTLHLDLYRRMSRLLFNLTLTEVKADQSEVEANEKLAGAVIQINGLPVNGTFTFEDNKLETDNIQPFQAYVTENGKQGQAIVFPAGSTKDVRFQVSLPQYPDTVYSFILSEDMILEECHSYELPLAMKYVYKPEAKKYHVKYHYEGGANKDNVIVTRSTTTMPWGEGDIIVVDENSDFTFQYQSNLKVSVRTEEGETLQMTSGKPYTFQQINKDITLIIYTEEEKPEPEPEKTYKVTYRYEGEANSNTVPVFKNGMSNAWGQTETITVKENADFTFGFRSDNIVSVKTKDGQTLSMASGSPYTFSKINKDIEIIIFAERPEYAVKYVFTGEYTDGNVNVQKGTGQSAFENWAKTQTVWVREGDNFTFKANSDFTVTVKVKDQELVPQNGVYSLKNINEDFTVVISTYIHKVTYQYTGEANASNVNIYKNDKFSAADKWTEKSEIVLVDHNGSFTFGTDSRHELVVTGNGTSLPATPVSGSATQNTFLLNKVTQDISVVINAKTEEDLLEHKVEYVLLNDAKGNTDVKYDSKTWNEDMIQTVDDGSDFSFNATGKYTLTVTASLTNDPTVDVPVTPSGSTYALSNIKKNVTVYISATTYTINYTYSGSYVDAVKVPIKEGKNLWKPGQEGTKVVDSNSDFTFTNNSEYTVTVSGYGEPFTVAPGASHKLENITENINLVISAAICKVTYEFDKAEPSDPVEDWLDVKYNNQNWTASNAGAQYIEKGKDFKFYTAPKKSVSGVVTDYVKVDKTDETGMTGNNGNFQSTIIKDTEFHIKAVKTHQISYEIKTAGGTTKPADFNVFKDSHTSWPEGDGGKVTIHAGKNFTFGYTSKTLNEYTITVTRNNTPVTIGNENCYTEKNVQSDIHYIITLAKKPYLTIEYDEGITPDVESGYVDYDSSKLFIPSIDPKWEITVTITGNGSSTETALTPDQNGQYTVENITKDTTITLKRHRKPADMPINADIHIWEELSAINGGIIYPKTN